MFRRPYAQKIFVLKVLCSEGSIFRRSYVQKVQCSERSYIQKVLYSESPVFRKKILYSDNSLFYVEKTYIFQFQVNCHQDNKSQPLILAHSVEGQMSFCHGALSVVCPSTICQNRYWDFNQHSEQLQIRSDHRRIVPPNSGIWHSCRSGNFRVFKFSRISDFGTFHFSNATIIIIFARFWSSRISSPREIREN